MKNIVKACRVEGLWKQKELADAVGISVPHLSLIENNKRTPSLEIAMTIAEFFRVDVEDIWTR